MGAINLGPGRQIVSKDSPNGVSRFAGQAGTQASDATPPPGQNRGSRAGSTTHILPADSERLTAIPDTRLTARSPAPLPGSGWPARTDNGQSQPPSGQDSGAPGQPISPPDPPRHRSPPRCRRRTGHSPGLSATRRYAEQMPNLRPVRETRQVTSGSIVCLQRAPALPTELHRRKTRCMATLPAAGPAP